MFSSFNIALSTYLWTSFFNSTLSTFYYHLFFKNFPLLNPWYKPISMSFQLFNRLYYDCEINILYINNKKGKKRNFLFEGEYIGKLSTNNIRRHAF